LVVGAALVVLVLGGASLAQQIARLTPSVGDIIAFQPGGEIAPGPPGDVLAFPVAMNSAARGRDACMLRVQTMAAAWWSRRST
jgi:hypothetical protein